jgi:hypothetical protein
MSINAQHARACKVTRVNPDDRYPARLPGACRNVAKEMTIFSVSPLPSPYRSLPLCLFKQRHFKYASHHSDLQVAVARRLRCITVLCLFTPCAPEAPEKAGKATRFARGS